MFRVPLQHNSGRATALAGVPCRQSSKHFISGQLKVIPLFRYSVFRVLQHPHNLVLAPGQLVTMYRIEIRGTIYYSRQYQRVKERNSYTIIYMDQNKLNKFALIEYFVYIHQRVIAVLKPLLPLHACCKEHFNLSTTIVDDASFLNPVTIGDSYSFCFAEDIVCKCLFVDFSSIQYVVQFPSSTIFD